MRKLLPALIALVLAWYATQHVQRSVVTSGENPQREQTSSNIGASPQVDGRQIQGSGRVTRVLADDNDGSRHQRFILRLPSGQTLLIAHNIDLAPRVEGLAVGDTVEFSGEYVANPQGGVVHWTHRDPQRRHADGWLRHRGREYR